MKKKLHLSRITAFAFSAAFFIFGSPAQAQVKGEISKLSFDKLPSPDVTLRGGKDKKFKPKDWFELEAEIKIPAQDREQKAYGFIDQITVKWYLAMEDNTTKKPILLTTDINHINVPVDETFFSSVYLSPNTMKRITGSDTVSSSSAKAVGVEVLVGGRMVAGKAEKMKIDWWKSASLSDQSRKYPLLNKYQTPFKMLWWDRYAEIEEPRR